MYIGFILNGRNELEYCRMLSSDVNDLDRRFGEFCFSQVRGQLKGAYLPEERIYCIEAAGEDGNQEMGKLVVDNTDCRNAGIVEPCRLCAESFHDKPETQVPAKPFDSKNHHNG